MFAPREKFASPLARLVLGTALCKLLRGPPYDITDVIELFREQRVVESNASWAT